MFPHILTNNTLTIVIDNKQLTINDDHPNFKKIIKKVKNDETDGLAELLSVKLHIAGESFGQLIIGDDDKLYYNDKEIHSSLTDRILRMFRDGSSIQHLVKFLENLMLNPLPSAINELYDFLEYGKMSITDDGHFLAFKKINKDYTDIYTGTIDNSIGAIVEMDRRHVDADKNSTCSTGLHFCSYDYLDMYGTNNSNIVVILKINPKDVVAIPSDYNNTKGRTCKYTVIADYDQISLTKSVVTTDIISMSVKQKILVQYIDNMMNELYGLTIDEMDLSSYITDYPDDYDAMISHIMNKLYDKHIKRDTAVKYFKFIKNHFGIQ